MTNRGSVAFISTSQRCSVSSADTAAESEASTLAGNEPAVTGGGGDLGGPGRVVVGHHHQFEEIAAGGDQRDRAAHSAGSDKQHSHGTTLRPKFLL